MPNQVTASFVWAPATRIVYMAKSLKLPQVLFFAWVPGSFMRMRVAEALFDKVMEIFAESTSWSRHSGEKLLQYRA